MIDDVAVEKSKAAAAEEKAETSTCDWSKAVTGKVTDKLHLKPADLQELHEKLDYLKEMDRRL